MHCVYMRARVCFPILASVRGQRSANLLLAGKADINGQVKVQSAFQTPNATTSYCTLVQPHIALSSALPHEVHLAAVFRSPAFRWRVWI